MRRVSQAAEHTPGKARAPNFQDTCTPEMRQSHFRPHLSRDAQMLRIFRASYLQRRTAHTLIASLQEHCQAEISLEHSTSIIVDHGTPMNRRKSRSISGTSGDPSESLSAAAGSRCAQLHSHSMSCVQNSRVWCCFLNALAVQREGFVCSFSTHMSCACDGNCRWLTCSD